MQRSKTARCLAGNIWESFMEEVEPVLEVPESMRLDCVVMGDGLHGVG